MEIEQFLYDLTEGGEAIVAYTMTTTDGTKVQLCNMGASVLSLTTPTSAGELDIAAGRCVMGLEEIEDTTTPTTERFDERLWESWVETNRVIMATSLAHKGANINIEVVFDMDDDNTFEITYQAYADADVEFDLTHALAIALGDDMAVEIAGAAQSDNLYAIDGAEPQILSQVARLTSSQINMEIHSSQPMIYNNPSTKTTAPVSPKGATSAANQRYIQKSLYRLHK